MEEPNRLESPERIEKSFPATKKGQPPQELALEMVLARKMQALRSYLLGPL